jgi:hypothetical protein
MRKWILTLALTGILGSVTLNAGTIVENRKNVFKIDKAKPVKKHKNKKYTNKVVKKTKRSGYKF